MLSRQRQVLTLQIQALRTEALQAERDLQDQHQRHQAELHCLREESLQVGQNPDLNVSFMIHVTADLIFDNTINRSLLRNESSCVECFPEWIHCRMQ